MKKICHVKNAFFVNELKIVLAIYRKKYVGAFMNMQEFVFVNRIYKLLHVETSIAKIKFSDNIQISISEGELW